MELMDQIYFLTNQNSTDIAALKVQLEHIQRTLDDVVKRLDVAAQENLKRDEKILDCSSDVLQILQILDRIVIPSEAPGSNDSKEFSLPEAIESLEKLSS